MSSVAHAETSVYEAQPGPQTWLVSCPIDDVLFGGARGGGKTWGILLDWLSHADLYEKHARGILFRRSYKGLEEVARIARILFRALGAWYKATGENARTWFFPSGASLKLSYLKRDRDAEEYQGHSYTWVGFEEITQYKSPEPIDLLRATLRTGEAQIPKSFRATANPGGVGHNWVKGRYIDPAPPFTPFVDEASGIERVFIPSRLDDNLELLKNDPDYWKQVAASVGNNKALLKAWRWGLWDIVAGGMFDDVWLRSAHVIKPFAIPKSWYVDRTFDWGSSAPFAVLWWAESDGTVAPNGVVYPRGTIFLIAEWYGSQAGRPNVGVKMLATEVADGVNEREALMRLKVASGPADSSIFSASSGVSTVSIADDMRKRGVEWTEADKSPGSRKIGWEAIRKYLKASRKRNPEEPGLYVFEHCVNWIRTVPTLPRYEKDPDDVDTDAEDHCGDATRYRLVQKRLVRSKSALVKRQAPKTSVWTP